MVETAGSRRSAQRRLLPACLAGVLLAVAGPAAALTLDWDVESWPDTSTRTQTYTIGGGDVIVTLSDVNNVLDAGTGPAGSPGSLTPIRARRSSHSDGEPSNSIPP